MNTSVVIPLDPFGPIAEAPAIPRKFSAAESDIIFNMDYQTDGITFAAVALWLESLTGKATTPADVEREYNARV